MWYQALLQSPKKNSRKLLAFNFFFLPIVAPETSIHVNKNGLPLWLHRMALGRWFIIHTKHMLFMGKLYRILGELMLKFETGLFIFAELKIVFETTGISSEVFMRNLRQLEITILLNDGVGAWWHSPLEFR